MFDEQAADGRIPAPRAAIVPGGGTLRLRAHSPAPGVLAIEADGVLDINAATGFGEWLRARMVPGAQTVVLDLSGLTFLSTHGVVALLEAGHRSLMCGVRLVLVTGNRVVDQLLGLLDVADRFDYASDVAEFAVSERPSGAPAPGPA
ncbi:STAS domain-containing protein [Saccharopolyspora sp. HNM0983]|uniref:STAS domain-containing protein n=1 Tax=Saccharopolyspora montiporae TaxID=2781240 RepID=A0A929FY34_9PSEU|nr:STAS domain-containing protein [Saccharopolyspora sp. HNM0983]MBE9375321.1 STAS domain-containing protein [Saccharopolyspora sp. HNM0983]